MIQPHSTRTPATSPAPSSLVVDNRGGSATTAVFLVLLVLGAAAGAFALVGTTNDKLCEEAEQIAAASTEGIAPVRQGRCTERTSDARTVSSDSGSGASEPLLLGGPADDAPPPTLVGGNGDDALTGATAADQQTGDPRCPPGVDADLCARIAAAERRYDELRNRDCSQAERPWACEMVRDSAGLSDPSRAWDARGMTREEYLYRMQANRESSQRFREGLSTRFSTVEGYLNTIGGFLGGDLAGCETAECAAGHATSGFIGVGDIRDIAVACAGALYGTVFTSRFTFGDCGVNTAALVPVYGDGLKVGAIGVGLIRRNAETVVAEALNWSWRSVKTFGHTFNTHGAGAQNLRRLQGRAASTGQAQGQWLDNDAAARFLAERSRNLNGPTSVEIPPGLGRVIRPDGSTVFVTRAMLIPKPGGGFRTAYPIE